MRIVLNVLFVITTLVLVTSCKTQTYTIESLCHKVGTTKTIVGLGESTHGTKEFTKLRSKIVHELVEKHNFRLFILEADYIICNKINNFILTGHGDPRQLLKELNLWPWNNQSFLELVLWMKEYNATHKDDPIQFGGMDAQFYSTYLQAKEMNLSRDYQMRYATSTRDTILKHYPERAKLVFNIEDSSIERSEKISNLKLLANNWKLDKSQEDIRLQYYVHTRIHNHSNEEPRNINARDEIMGDLVESIQTKFNQKAIVWAHNGHIYKGHEDSSFIPLGSHLHDKYASQYVAIGFDFKEGSFSAISLDEGDNRKMKAFKYKRIADTHSSQIDFKEKDYFVTECSSLKSDVYINSIGALYKTDPVNIERFNKMIRKDKEFDYIIHVPLSTPTEILKN